MAIFLISFSALANATGDATCGDSDGGKNYYTFGIVSGYIGETPFYYTDTCAYANASNLVEYYCDPVTQIPYTDVKTCLNGCANGVCITLGVSPSPTPAPNSCIDSDGINLDAKGTVSGIFHEMPYTRIDTCLDDTYILEYYCVGMEMAQMSQQCRSDRPKCVDGSCIPTATPTTSPSPTPVVSQFPFTCTDSDGGENYYLKGSVSGLSNGIAYSHSDTCDSSSRLIEYVCDGYDFERFFITCPVSKPICSNGACTSNGTAPSPTAMGSPAPDSCYDSDGGYYPDRKGTVSGMSNSVQYSKTDKCNENGDIVEYTCFGRSYRENTARCPDGLPFCIDGKCMETQNATPAPSVQNGVGSIRAVTTPEGAYFYLDGYFSGLTPASVNLIRTGTHTYLFAKEGYGVKTGSVTVVLNEVALIEANLTMMPNATDPANSSYNGSLSVSASVFPSVQLLQDSCKDSDGGFDIYKQGTIAGMHNGNAYEMAEYCSNATLLTEYFCMGTEYEYAPINCGGQCVDGYCNVTPFNRSILEPARRASSFVSPTPTPSPTPYPTPPVCTDTDGGVNYYTKGTVLLGRDTPLTDSCRSDKILFEFSCNNVISQGEAYTCPDACEYGACVDKPKDIISQIISFFANLFG
ncbi:MAG: PEGA domain-containing protein [Candidatus Micrarchaeota archaeon]